MPTHIQKKSLLSFLFPYYTLDSFKVRQYFLCQFLNDRFMFNKRLKYTFLPKQQVDCKETIYYIASKFLFGGKTKVKQIKHMYVQY